MSWVEFVAVLLAGVAAGTVNTIVGSGTLITFPTILAFGYPAVVANVSNNVGLVPGGISGTWGYRAELEGQRRRLLRLGPMSLLGSITGALLLLRLPAEAFAAIVPVLLAISLILVVIQPRVQAAVRRRRAAQAATASTAAGQGSAAFTMAGVFLAGVYGGYFGAAQGVLLVGLLGALLPESLQRVNALKNALTVMVNAMAALTFLAVAMERIDWWLVAAVAAGSSIGGLVGARIGRRLPPLALRILIVVVGVVAIVRILAG